MKYQSNNPFRKTLNANVPLLLLLNTMKALKNQIGDSKIHKSEIAFFLCWRDSNFQALAEFILNFRALYPHFCYSNEVIYEECLKLLESENKNRFKISQVCGESIDEYIRKMRICGIISLRGSGRFLDFNSFELAKIDYVIHNYSKFQTFSNKKAYFTYMGSIDERILEIKEIVAEHQESLKLQTLQNFAKQYSKEQIYKELKILGSKKSYSNDEVFKFIPEPTRFEFLTAIALKQHLTHLEIMPNYSIDDEGLPKSHASGNQADIVCKDTKGWAIVEVSLICGRAQVNNELIPITRHLNEMIQTKKIDNMQEIKSFALFIAPKIFEDSKRYVKFLAYDEGLDIRNFDILTFIQALEKINNHTPFSINEIFSN
ncbi:AlwI family type II restriction endonuclease [Helicobacter marmotae]|uniref:AlwI family type II restriction endonuclease n=1 Tax=Helicobacter marmotae TaxID=152490 RepID=A0A3D8I2W5_9HELI|nr:AlwI family type II restriction endonuclease [Helicobacter marmotae]RDU59427.1 AlwI family type II restriction endonuclease [Helicobacter marmotae]